MERPKSCDFRWVALGVLSICAIQGAFVGWRITVEGVISPLTWVLIGAIGIAWALLCLWVGEYPRRLRIHFRVKRDRAAWEKTRTKVRATEK